ncbi:unnamed protein product [Colias eurytheme]|nr:unnamed protein product [Colias eurytheme]
MVTVCKEFFKVTFSVTNKRLQTINTSTYKGDLPQENRGGDRRSTKSEEKKQSLRNFLKALPAKESHYNRLKSKRIYLSSELNGAKLLRYYNSSVPANLRVSRSMFYDIFYKDFNIGFSCPSSDACNVCTLWSNKIKNECDPAKKQILMVEKRVHKLRANAFYQYMKDEVEGSISFCFDLQQVQPLPRTPIQDAFYSRQVCIVDLKSKKPTFFTWNETQASRGSVEIGSALYTYLNGLDIPAEITTLRLFCDGCGGQNKNNHIIHMLLFWLHNNAPPHLRQINLTFPVRGHSFLPADRVFGRLEKEIRKFPVITTPKEYHKIFENHENGILPEETKDTADLIIFIDDLFDSLNGSFQNSKNRSGKDLLRNVTPSSKHSEVWSKSKKVLKSMKFVTVSGSSGTVPSINNWVHTVENMELLKETLFNKYNMKSMWCRHLNQDP